MPLVLRSDWSQLMTSQNAKVLIDLWSASVWGGGGKRGTRWVAANGTDWVTVFEKGTRYFFSVGLKCLPKSGAQGGGVKSAWHTERDAPTHRRRDAARHAMQRLGKHCCQLGCSHTNVLLLCEQSNWQQWFPRHCITWCTVLFAAYASCVGGAWVVGGGGSWGYGRGEAGKEGLTCTFGGRVYWTCSVWYEEATVITHAQHARTHYPRPNFWAEKSGDLSINRHQNSYLHLMQHSPTHTLWSKGCALYVGDYGT